MKNSERAKSMTKDQIYEMLMSQLREEDARRLNAPSLMNKAPKGGWTDADKVK